MNAAVKNTPATMISPMARPVPGATEVAAFGFHAFQR
jgi:hypothetical protein